MWFPTASRTFRPLCPASNSDTLTRLLDRPLKLAMEEAACCATCPRRPHFSVASAAVAPAAVSFRSSSASRSTFRPLGSTGSRPSAPPSPRPQACSRACNHCSKWLWHFAPSRGLHSAWNACASWVPVSSSPPTARSAGEQAGSAYSP